MKRFILILTIIFFTGCNSNDAYVVSRNISTEADSFRINRRIVFYDAIQGEYLLSIEGRCSIDVDKMDKQLEVTCKDSENSYKKHYLGISDNVTYFAEQLDSSDVSSYRYKIVFKPTVIIPDIEIR